MAQKVGRREKLPQNVGRREKLARKEGRMEIYLPVPPPSMIGDFSVLPPELHRGEKMWMIAGFPDEMWMLQKPKEVILAFFSKQKAIFQVVR